MKKTIGSVVVLAAVVLGGYYGTGLITERTLKKNIQMINHSNNVSVNLVAYQRGWFHSKANLVWHIQMPERFVSTQQGDSALVPSQTYSFETPVLIYHGPVSLEKSGVHFGLGYATTEVQIPESYKKQFDEVFAKESIAPVVHASMFVSYFNQTHLHLQVPPFHLITIKNKDVIEWGGLESDFAVSAKKYHINGHLTLNGANVSSGNMTLTLGKVDSEYDMHQNKDGLYLGDASIAFPSLVLMKDKAVDFELADVDTKSESEVNDGLFQSSFHGSFEKLTRHGKSYGPGRVTVELENLDAKVLANINDQASKMQRIPDSQRQQALLMMLPQLSTLLGKGATFEIAEFNIGMPDGVFDASLRVALPKGEQGNPFQLIQKVEGKGKVKIPVQLLKTLLTRSVTESLILQAEKEKLETKTPDVTGTEVSEASLPATSAPVVPAEPVSQGEAKKSATSPDDVKALDLASSPEFKQKVIVSVDKKIADLVNAGAIRLEGENYCLDLNLTAGQLSVNGHPFSPVMLQF